MSENKDDRLKVATVEAIEADRVRREADRALDEAIRARAEAARVWDEAIRKVVLAIEDKP